MFLIELLHLSIVFLYHCSCRVFSSCDCVTLVVFGSHQTKWHIIHMKNTNLFFAKLKQQSFHTSNASYQQDTASIVLSLLTCLLFAIWHGSNASMCSIYYQSFVKMLKKTKKQLSVVFDSIGLRRKLTFLIMSMHCTAITTERRYCCRCIITFIFVCDQYRQLIMTTLGVWSRRSWVNRKKLWKNASVKCT